jgi:hypothetical protein
MQHRLDAFMTFIRLSQAFSGASRIPFVIFSPAQNEPAKEELHACHWRDPAEPNPLALFHLRKYGSQSGKIEPCHLTGARQ